MATPPKTICCLNPDCLKPENPSGTKYCSSCGKPLTILRGHYHPIELLSDEGGFGRAYLAQDTDRLNTTCVIKQLAPQLQGTNALAIAQRLFEGEAEQLQKLGQNNQIPLALKQQEVVIG
jgi:serine/threonine protein kinase